LWEGVDDGWSTTGAAEACDEVSAIAEADAGEQAGEDQGGFAAEKEDEEILNTKY
jgi:hypothetical protein